MGKLFFLTMGLPGLIMLGVAGYFGVTTIEFIDGAAHTTGTTVATSPPSVEYEIDGRSYTVHGDISSDPPVYDMGERVGVFYDPDDPSDARINGILELYFVPGLLGLLGGIFFVIGGIVVPWFLRTGKVKRSAFDLGTGGRLSMSSSSSSGRGSGNFEPHHRTTVARLLRMGSEADAQKYVMEEVGVSEREAASLVRQVKREQ